MDGQEGGEEGCKERGVRRRECKEEKVENEFFKACKVDVCTSVLYLDIHKLLRGNLFYVCFSASFTVLYVTLKYITR